METRGFWIKDRWVLSTGHDREDSSFGIPREWWEIAVCFSPCLSLISCDGNFLPLNIYICLDNTHTKSILNIKSWAASQCTEQGLDREELLIYPWAPVPGSSTPIPLCWLHTPGVAEHSRRQQLHLRVHTHTYTHTQSTFGLQLESTRMSLLSPTPVSAVQLDTIWMGLSMPSPASWGACNVLSCPLNLHIWWDLCA